MKDDTKHKQLMGALDLIAKRLVEVEKERESLKKSLEQTRKDQDAFQDLLM